MRDGCGFTYWPRTAMPYIISMYSFIETRLFTRLVREYLTDHEYSESVRDNIATDVLRQIRREVEDE